MPGELISLVVVHLGSMGHVWGTLLQFLDAESVIFHCSSSVFLLSNVFGTEGI